MSVTDKTGRTAASKAVDAGGRLQQAALELFRQRGYERVTAAEIAERAGVTERTFFRHFADKREVLFGGEAVLREALAASIAEAPRGLAPLAVLFRSFRSVEALLAANRPFAVPRQQILDATPALQERELAKHAALADALAAALQARGVAALPAALAARTGMGAFVHATLLWLRSPRPSLGKRLASAESELIAMVSSAHRGPARPPKK